MASQVREERGHVTLCSSHKAPWDLSFLKACCTCENRWPLHWTQDRWVAEKAPDDSTEKHLERSLDPSPVTSLWDRHMHSCAYAHISGVHQDRRRNDFHSFHSQSHTHSQGPRKPFPRTSDRFELEAGTLPLEPHLQLPWSTITISQNPLEKPELR
jgi:hypothetical protein